MQAIPYWTDDCHPPQGLSTVLPSKVDLAIIGGGYTGLHAAIAAVRNGASVALLEAESVGWGASSRNGGMLNPGLKLSAQELFHRYGEHEGRRLWSWSLDAIDFVEDFVTSAQIECDFHRHGQVVLAYKPQHFTKMRSEVSWHQEYLQDSLPQLLGPIELMSEIGSPSYFGGIFDPRSAGLHPAKYVFGLARVAHDAGVQIVEHSPVLALKTRSDGYEVTTAQGHLIAPKLLLATNGYTNNLVPGARRGIFAGGSYIITTDPLSPELQHSVIPRGRMFYDSKHFLNYFRLTPDGRMLIGGRHNLATDLPLDKSASELRRRLCQIFPQLEEIALSHSWTGKLGLTFDLMPHAGRLQDGPTPGIYYAYGFGGHGVAIASYLGNLMGRHLTDEATDNPILALPHSRYFFTPYEKYYLPLVSAWFRFLDQVS